MGYYPAGCIIIYNTVGDAHMIFWNKDSTNAKNAMAGVVCVKDFSMAPEPTPWYPSPEPSPTWPSPTPWYPSPEPSPWYPSPEPQPSPTPAVECEDEKSFRFKISGKRRTCTWLAKQKKKKRV